MYVSMYVRQYVSMYVCICEFMYVWMYALMYACMYVCRKEGRSKGNVLFKDALNTFYLQLYCVRHIVKDHSDTRDESRCRHKVCSFRLAARVLLYTSSHRHACYYMLMNISPDFLTSKERLKIQTRCDISVVITVLYEDELITIYPTVICFKSTFLIEETLV